MIEIWRNFQYLNVTIFRITWHQVQLIFILLNPMYLSVTYLEYRKTDRDTQIARKLATLCTSGTIRASSTLIQAFYAQKKWIARTRHTCTTVSSIQSSPISEWRVGPTGGSGITCVDGRAAENHEAEQKEQALPAAFRLHLHHPGWETRTM